MKQHYKQFSGFLGFVLVLVLALGFNVAILAQETRKQEVKEDEVWAQKGLEYLEKEDYPAALECFQKALNMNPGIAKYLNNIGFTYNALGEKEKALEYYKQALSLIRSTIGNRSRECTILTNIGDVYSGLGEREKALEYYEKALSLYITARDQAGEAVTLTDIGAIYKFLGKQEKALEYYEKALPLLRAVGDRSGEAAALNNIGSVYNNLGKKEKALGIYENALPLSRVVGDRSGEATILNNIGGVYNSLNEKRKALEYYEKALSLSRFTVDRAREASIQNNIGLVCCTLGENKKALEYFKNVLQFRRVVGDITGEASTLNNIGLVYCAIGENKTALEYYEKALSLHRMVGERSGEAITLNNIGGVYHAIGENEKAMSYYEKALPINREVGDRAGEATTLNNIGAVYSALGKKEKALEYFEKSLPICHSVGDYAREASTLTNMGLAYSALGENEKSLKYYEKALPLFLSVGDRSGEATTLNNIGLIYNTLGEKKKALAYYEKALPLYRDVGNRFGEATTLNNIGYLYNAFGENEKALEYYESALPLNYAVDNRSGEATTLNNIGYLYNSLGENEKALEYYEKSFPIYRAVGDRSGEAIVLSNLMAFSNYFNHKPLAIFWGKQSVNGLQQLRENIVNLNKETKNTYLKTEKKTYRYLVNLTIMRQRLDEALLVLDMLKAEEYYQFIKKDSTSSFPDRQYKPLEFTPFEQQWLDKFNTITSNFTTVSNQYHVLLISKPKTESEQTRLAELKKQLDDAKSAYEKYLVDLKAAFAQKDQKVQNGEKEGLNMAARPDSIQSTLRNLDKKESGKNVSLHYFVYENKIHIILTTPTHQILQSTILDEKALKFMIEKFQVTMNRPKPHSISVIKHPFDKTIIPILINLYNLVFKPIEKDLTSYGATNIMLYLDGDLRNIPFPALCDGRNFLVQRFHISILTTSSMLNINDAPVQNLKILGMAATKGSKDFHPLNSAKDEIHAIVKDTPHNFNGFIDGKALLDSDFTKPAMFEQLKTASYPLVLITSHFNFALNGENQNFLLMGDESKLTLKEIREADHLFKNVDMLVLSACQTAQGSSRGIEIDSFAELAQRSGAKSVVASLWSVNDESTKKLMVAFYRNLNEKRFSSKIEALRQAQLELAGLDDLLQPDSQQKREKTVYASPYYWGPFVMFGNWK